MRERRSPDRLATCVVIRPELRDSNIERERLSPDRTVQTVYWNLNARFPPVSTDQGWFARERLTGTIAACIAPAVTTLIIPEPLWIRYWPRAVVVALAARAMRIVLRRPPLSIGFYAIDNLDPDERLTHPLLDGHPRLNRWFSRGARFVLRQTTSLVANRVAFGTSDAESNYRVKGILPRTDHVQAVLIPEIHGTCPACFGADATAPAPLENRPRRVLFLGELSARKGLDILVDAWAESTLRSNGWTLLICGSGELDERIATLAEHDPSVELARPDRDEVHALLRSARAVVLPSRRVRRWREQIGLSMLEGEAHGCALIVSDESGAAQELAGRASARIVASGDRHDLAAALNALPTAMPAHPSAHDSGGDVRRFLATGAIPARAKHG